MAKNHPLMKDVKNWILDSFSFMDGIGYDIQFADDIFGMENTKAFSIDIDGLTDFDFEKGKKNLLKSIPNKIKAEFPYLRISSTRDGNYFVMFITLLDNNDYLEDTKLTYINLNESKESARKSIKEERYNVELSDYSGSIVDEETFDKKSDAIQWAKDNGRNCYARIWDNEEGKTVKEWKVKSIRESSVRCVTFEQIVDSRFDDISKGEKILNDRKDEIIELCGDDFSVYTNKIEFLDWGDDESQYRQKYYIRKNNNNVSWNDLYKIVNSVKAVPYKFDKINDSVFESRKSIEESINGDCYIYYDDDDNKRLVFCDYVKGITDTRNWFYLNEYIIDAIHIFKNEKQAQKFIDEHLKYFADQDKVVIAEYPQTVGGFFESKELVRKSIKESVEFYNDFGTGVYCATSSNGWTFCYCPLSWINKKGVEDLIGWSIMDDKAHYIEGDSWENKTDEEINDSIDNFEKLIKKYTKEDAKEIIQDFRSTLDKD